MSVNQARSVFRHLGKLVQVRREAAAPDQELLTSYIANRDEAAFAALADRHGSMVLGICRRLLGSAQDAEDACQAVFLVLARKAASIRKRQSLASWLYGTAMRIAQKARSRQRKALIATPQPQESIESQLSLREALSILDEELYRLPAGQQAALIQCYLEGRTQDEAARQLGWSQGKLRGQLERGRERLRARLIRRGVSLPAALLLTALTQTAASAAISTACLATITKAAALLMEKQAVNGAKVGRNDPCPCGSGKKYKKCHGLQ